MNHQKKWKIALLRYSINQVNEVFIRLDKQDLHPKGLMHLGMLEGQLIFGMEGINI